VLARRPPSGIRRRGTAFSIFCWLEVPEFDLFFLFLFLGLVLHVAFHVFVVRAFVDRFAGDLPPPLARYLVAAQNRRWVANTCDTAFRALLVQLAIHLWRSTPRSSASWRSRLLRFGPSGPWHPMKSLYHRQTHCNRSKNSRENQACSVPGGVLLVIAHEMREN